MSNISTHTEGQASSFMYESHADFISQHSWNSASQMCPKDRNCEPIFLLIRSAVSMERCEAIMHTEVVHWRLPVHSQQHTPVFFFFGGGGGHELV